MASASKKTLAQLPTLTLLTSSLPVDSFTSDPDNLPSRAFLTQTRPVYKACFSYLTPEEAPDPRLLAVSRTAMELLDLDEKESETDEFVQIFSGNKVLEGTHPWALCYGGHQFGYWAGQLGDGRAISLFETVNSRQERWELQLKGAGRTPYSRFADGYAVLRSSIREFLCSEALSALSVPTTRALSLIVTSRDVYREDAPSDARQPEKGAIVCRVAPSWLRFGNFEILHSRKDAEGVRQLAEFIAREVIVVPEGKMGEEKEGWNRFGRMFREVARKTAQMVAGWQSVGFCHGVMNTDNMSILGLTLDFGPFSFLDAYDPTFICNHSDDQGRYAFRYQPTACMWNLDKLGTCLAELIGAGDDVDIGVDSSTGTVSWDDTTRAAYRARGEALVKQWAADDFEVWFLDDFTKQMRRKLGLVQEDTRDFNDVLMPLLNWMSNHTVDYHWFFRALSNVRANADLSDLDLDALVPGVTHEPGAAKAALRPWLELYQQRVASDEGSTDAERKSRMDAVNPKFVLRNWVAQEVIAEFENKGEEKGREALKQAAECCLDPFREEYEGDWAKRWTKEEVPKWGQCLQCSCSS